MAGMVVYPIVPNSVIRESADSLLEQVPPWFEANPDRVDCVLAFHYGRIIEVTRANYREVIEAVAAECTATEPGGTP